MVPSHAEHVHSLCMLLHSKCYCNIWHVFCWHLFSLLFLMWIKLSEIRAFCFLHFPEAPLTRIQTYCKTFFLFSNLQAVNRWAALTGGGCGLICLHPYPYELEWTDKIEPAQWNVWFIVLAGVSPFMPCSSCRQIERSLLLLLLLLLLLFFQLILHWLYLCGRRVPSFAIWQSNRNKFTNKKKTGLRTQQGSQKRPLVQDTS